MGDVSCIFCKIVAGEIPSVKIREDENFLAILDAFPTTKGQALVLSKRHADPDIFVLEDSLYVDLMLAVKKVVEVIKQWLRVSRVGIVVEGLEVPHAHVRMYPFYKGQWFVNSIGTWPKADMEELSKVADEMQSNLQIH